MQRLPVSFRAFTCQLAATALLGVFCVSANGFDQELAPIRNKEDLNLPPIVSKKQLKKRQQAAAQQTDEPAARQAALTPRSSQAEALQRPAGGELQTDVPSALDSRSAAYSGELNPAEQDHVRVFQQTNRSVVHVATRSVTPDAFMRAEGRPVGSGCGVVLDQSGHVLTCLNVIEGAREIRVMLHNGREYNAALVGQDPVTNTAVVKIAAAPELLQPVTLAANVSPMVGQQAYLVDNPFGLERTLRLGIVSAVNRTVPAPSGRALQHLLQTDIAYNGSDSGCPIFDSQGQMIGLTTQVGSPGTHQGIGFALPASTLAEVTSQLVATGQWHRNSLGIAHLHPVEDGLMVASLLRNGPAEKAGVQGFRVARRASQRGAFRYDQTVVERSHADVIQSIDGQAIDNVASFRRVLAAKKPGDIAVLGVLRDEQIVTLRVPVTVQR